MTTKYLTPAQQELLAVLSEADALSKRSEPSKRDDARMSFLLAKQKALLAGMAPTDHTSEFFRDLFKGKLEQRQLQEGTQSISHTQGPEGGFLVPNEFHDEVVQGMAQFDPLLNKDIVTLIESGDGSLRPYTIPGWDMSTFAAVKVAETQQQVGGVPPTVSGVILNGYKYKASLPATIELEEDTFQAMQMLMENAYAIAFARGIGADLVLGNGSTAPQGVLTSANVYTTLNTGKLVLNDFESVYFNINRFHRAAPKCAWLMCDATYQLARQAVDSEGNPLLKLIKDKEVIMGKPVYVCPSLPAYNASLGVQQKGSFCVFGDLSHLYVRISKLSVKRQWQLPGYVENGMALYTGMMRADAKVFDPTGGSTPPIVSATLHE